MNILNLAGGTYLGVNRHRMEVGGIAVCKTEYHRPVYEGWHAHEHSHVTFILDGGNQEQRKGLELEATPGTVLLYNAEQQHRNLHTAHPSKNLNLELPAAFFSTYHTALQPFSAAVCSQATAKFCLLKIYRECQLADVHSEATIHSLLLDLLSASLDDGVEKLAPSWVRLLRELLHDCWQETLSLQQLSQTLQLHPVTISKCFPRYFGCTLGDYQRQLKIAQAVRLIRETTLSLTQISYECGFFDQSHFTKAFKRVSGFLPRGYRSL